jgi:hypothetical protein
MTNFRVWVTNLINLNQKKSPTAKATGDFLNAFED